jgi:tRNA-specific 2-thiouridylase
VTDPSERKARVLVAMSGGVDSSVAAALVKSAGDEAVGVWMRLSDAADSRSEFGRSCCSLDAAEDARRVASQLDIPFYILNLEREFDEGVVAPFLRSYLAGRTPSPCVDCNTVVKFGALLGRARLQYECDAVATGHYARVAAPGDADAGEGVARAPRAGYRLLRGIDPDKDQSYFLCGLGQAELAHVRFPLGGMTKPQVRDAARAMGLATADKRDSQEICFVPRGDWKIDPSANTVKLGRRDDLETRRFEVEEVHFVAGEPPEASGDPADGFRAEVQIRHRGRVAAATVLPRPSGRWQIETDEPVWAAAPGQAAVFYHGEVVLGGGRIARSDDADRASGIRQRA